MADPETIAAHLRDLDSEEEGATYLDAQKLDHADLLAVAAELRLSRLERLSKPKLRQRIVHQAITARKKFQGLLSGWQDD